MTDLSPRDFLLADLPSLADLSGLLDANFHLTSEPVSSVEFHYLDTFDWRLHALGGSLRLERRGREKRLVWLNGEDRPAAQAAVDGIPVWPADLPEGPIWRPLAKAIDIRALLDQATVKGRVQQYRVLNADQKTVVRLELLAFPESADQQPEASARGRLQILPLRGYDKAFAQVASRLVEGLGLAEVEGSLLSSLLRTQGRMPGDYSSKIQVELDPEERADRSLLRIYRQLLNTLEANIEGSKSGLDSEFVHDLRVACRRTRSAITQVKGVLPDAVVSEYKERFAWLQEITGPTRDMDVFLLAIPDYQASLPEPLRAHLEPLRDFLQVEQAKAQRKLKRDLGGRTFLALMSDWRNYLDSALPDQPDAPNATRPTRQVANQRIWKMYRRVISEGEAITEQSPEEDLHEMRKSCKKLRYLIEFFQIMYPDKPVKRQVKALKSLLDCLGDFQDLAVQAEKLEHFAEAMQTKGRAPLMTLIAIGALVGDLLHRQEQRRAEFAAKFNDFASTDNREQFRGLFKPGSAGPERAA